MNRILLAIGNYKWGTTSYVIAAFVVFICAILVVQYEIEGRVDPLGMVNTSDPDLKRILDANPTWEYVDHHSRTSLYTIRERNRGDTALIDLAVLSSAGLKPRACDAAALPPQGAQFAAAAGMVCFQIVKAQDSESPYVSAVSFTAKAKQSEVAHFYHALLTREGRTITAVQDSSRATILDVEDKRRNTVARVSVRSAFDTSYVFFAWTADFR